MARKANIVSDFLSKTFPNITDRAAGSPAAKSRAEAAKRLAVKKRETARKNAAEGPKRSVAKKRLLKEKRLKIVEQ